MEDVYSVYSETRRQLRTTGAAASKHKLEEILRLRLVDVAAFSRVGDDAMMIVPTGETIAQLSPSPPSLVNVGFSTVAPTDAADSHRCASRR
eukprot:m.320493 g.320493  ORF g.320493 m.320493 type:complete len:92 (-) comp27588_c1_seq44:6306-6581(-)